MDTTYTYVSIAIDIDRLQRELIDLDDYSEEVYQSLEKVLDAIDEVLNTED